MPSVTHYDIPADDLERAKKFYGDTFGWRIEDVEGINYTLVDSKGDKGIAGGIYLREMPEQRLMIHIDVPDIDEYASKVETAGGEIAVPKNPAPGMGWVVICRDTEGNFFGLWQDDKEAK